MPDWRKQKKKEGVLAEALIKSVRFEGRAVSEISLMETRKATATYVGNSSSTDKRRRKRRQPLASQQGSAARIFFFKVSRHVKCANTTVDSFVPAAPPSPTLSISLLRLACGLFSEQQLRIVE